MTDSNRRTPASTSAAPGTVQLETAEYCTGLHRGHEYIWCRRCGMASYNANDIRERYCGRCARFHGEPDPEAVLAALYGPAPGGGDSGEGEGSR